MTNEEILAVATRCETEEPNPYLASAILVAAGHQTLYRGEKLGWEWRKDGVGVWSTMPRPDLSLDAAVTLVPEGWNWSVEYYVFDAVMPYRKPGAKASVWRDSRNPKERIFNIEAATEALALRAAALRARAAVATEEANIGATGKANNATIPTRAAVQS